MSHHRDSPNAVQRAFKRSEKRAAELEWANNPALLALAVKIERELLALTQLRAQSITIPSPTASELFDRSQWEAQIAAYKNVRQMIHDELNKVG